VAKQIADLRNHLFDTLERLKANDPKMDTDRARAIVEVGQVIIDSARAEVEFMRATGRVDDGTGFIPSTTAPRPRLTASNGR
jgi:hypothetical protein